MTDLTELTARAAVDLLRQRKVSPLEMIDAAIARIEATDAPLNALPTLCIDRARAHAERIMKTGPAGGDNSSWLGGLPIAAKDLNDVAGVRTTYGSPIFADHIPEKSDIALWDPNLERTVTWDDLHDDVGYTPYEGMTVKGWPILVMSRGRVAVENGELLVERGSGTFLTRGASLATKPLGRLSPEMDPARNFGADILPRV